MDLPPPPNPNNLPPADASSFNSIFGNKPAAPSINPDTISQVNSLGRRVRMMEEAVMNVRRKIEIQEEDALKANKSTSTNVQTLFGEIDDLKHQVKSFKDDMIKIIKELQSTAKKEDFAALQKYVELWQPIKFVTQQEVASIVDHVIDQRLSDKRIVEQLIESKIGRSSIEAAAENPERLRDIEPEPLVETIREKVRDAKRIPDDDEEPEVPARPAPIAKPKEKINTDPFPSSILQSLASNIERERKSVSESHIHPKDPNTDIQDVDNKKDREQKDKEVDQYRARINDIMKRKKELHDLLGK
jgi:hypothetical protein